MLSRQSPPQETTKVELLTMPERQQFGLNVVADMFAVVLQPVEGES
jgi:hypothetical protein